jgi:hypothetical protein
MNLIPFDKKTRQQIVVIELVNSLFCGLKGNDLPPKSKTCLAGIIARAKKIKDYLYRNQETPVFSSRDFKKHQRIFKKLRSFVSTSYGDKVTLDYYNAVMMMAFDVADQVHGPVECVEHWQRVTEMMETVYQHMEGLGEHNHYIARGVHIKERIEWIVRAA